VVNLCGGERVAEWMWHNIWRENGRWESGLVSIRWRVYPDSMTSIPMLLAPVSCVAVLLESIGFSPRLLLCTTQNLYEFKID
jgi:hypothetical protein